MLGYLYSGDSGDAGAVTIEMGPADGHGPGAAAFGFFFFDECEFYGSPGDELGSSDGG